MNCINCGNIMIETDNFCSECGCATELSLINNKKIRLINIFRIFDIMLYLGLFIYLIILYINLLFNQGSFPYVFIIFIAPIVIAALLYVGWLILSNIIGGRNFVVENIKSTAIMQIILGAIISLLTYISYLYDYDYNFIFFIIILIVDVLLLVYNIYRLILVRGIKKQIHSSLKSNSIFIKCYFVITAIILIIMLIIAFLSPVCDKHYKIDEKQLKKQLKQYTYIGEEEFEYYSTGFECRSKNVQTYIFFYDKYNNKINLTISDSSKGQIDLNYARFAVDRIQFVNNVLKNQKLKIVYNDKGYYWDCVDISFDDEILENSFSLVLDIYQEELYDIILHSYDIKDTNYLVNITLYDKIKANVDKGYIMQHLDSFVSFLYKTIGSEHINNIVVHLGNEEFKLKEYLFDNVVWEKQS